MWLCSNKTFCIYNEVWISYNFCVLWNIVSFDFFQPHKKEKLPLAYRSYKIRQQMGLGSWPELGDRPLKLPGLAPPWCPRTLEVRLKDDSQRSSLSLTTLSCLPIYSHRPYLFHPHWQQSPFPLAFSISLLDGWHILEDRARVDLLYFWNPRAHPAPLLVLLMCPGRPSTFHFLLLLSPAHRVWKLSTS